MRIRTQRLNSTNDKYFHEAWELYLSAFPEEERRDIEYQSEVLSNEAYHCEVVMSDGSLVGILFWWELPSSIYIEHLATLPSLRGAGIGADIIKELQASTQKPIILEVELPEGEIERRRIGFYERLGFHLSEAPYAHPSYSTESDELVILALMSYPNAIGIAEAEEFKAEAFPLVHPRRAALLK